MTVIDTLSIVVTAIASLGAAGFAYQARKKVETVHLLINSRMDELLKTTDALARAQGLAEGLASHEQTRPRET